MTILAIPPFLDPSAESQKHHIYNSVDMRRVTTVVLCGGQGVRLFPLTQTRCKPAMSFGGRYRLIDFPISNAINSGCRNVFVLTQFLANSLHKHVFSTYRTTLWPSTSVDILTCEERPEGKTWFRGTADAVRQTFSHIAEAPGDYVLVLSGDQVYRMDFHSLMHTALETNADVVVASLPITTEEAPRMGVLKINDEGAITDFCEKPQTLHQLTPFALTKDLIRIHDISIDKNKKFLGSMGIYLFKKAALLQLLKDDLREDFGKHLIPHKVSQGNIYTHIHHGYWEDIGTIASFYNANIALTDTKPLFNLNDEHWPLFASVEPLPGAKIGNTKINHSIFCEGSVINAKEVINSILGPRTTIQAGCSISHTYIMGHEFEPSEKGHINSIGHNTVIQKAIIDKHVTIGSNVRLTNEKNLQSYDSDIAYIRDGIIIIPRGANIPDGYTL